MASNIGRAAEKALKELLKPIAAKKVNDVKRPLSAYMLHNKSRRPSMVEEMVGGKPSEVTLRARRTQHMPPMAPR